MKKNLLALLALTIPLLSIAQNGDIGLDQKIDKAFQPIADGFFDAIFFPIYKSENIEVPFVLVLLVGSAFFFTLYFKFPNIRHFWRAINVVRGTYDDIDHHESGNSELAIDGDIKDTIEDESKEGEVSHFQALATAVSGTVGNGNIAGVALAIALGGPGATFWMIICGLLGMSWGLLMAC